jgi:hypothetical protein
LTEKKENENADDPCHGKPKEFFLLEYNARANKFFLEKE